MEPSIDDGTYFSEFLEQLSKRIIMDHLKVKFCTITVAVVQSANDAKDAHAGVAKKCYVTNFRYVRKFSSP